MAGIFIGEITLLELSGSLYMPNSDLMTDSKRSSEYGLLIVASTGSLI
jgi:hypothetical protein